MLYHWRANSIYQPDFSHGLADKPQGYEDLLGQYNAYYVLGSDLHLRATGQVPISVHKLGLALQCTDTVNTYANTGKNCDLRMRTPGIHDAAKHKTAYAKTKFVADTGAGTDTARYDFGPFKMRYHSKMYKMYINEVGDGSAWQVMNANPAHSIYFAVFIWQASPETDVISDQLQTYVTELQGYIDYYVLVTDRKQRAINA